MNSFDVIVIGGGLSGLSAADLLLKRKHDLNLLLLEAKDRVGGRTVAYSLRCSHGERDVWDLGGQWVCYDQKYVMKLITELDLTTYPQYTKGKKLVELGDGKIRSYKGEIPNIGSIRGLIQLQYFLSRCESLSRTTSVKQPAKGLNAEYDSDTVSSIGRKYISSNLGYQLISSALKASLGADSSRVSALFFLYYSKAAGGVMKILSAKEHGAQEAKVKGGIHQMSEKLMNRIGDWRVKLNSPVTSISNDENGVLINTKNGDSFTAKAVIVAIPPNQILNIDISPPLVQTRTFMMNNMKMGNMIKFIVTYERAFWRDLGYSGEIVTNGGNSIIEGCDEGPLSVVFDATTLGGHPALVGLTGGNQAVQWSCKSLLERKKAILSGLARFFGEQALKVLEYREKVWNHEEYVGGCPVNTVPPGVMSFFHEIRLPHHKMYFAGTETALEWPGFLNGAIESANRASAELLRDIYPHYMTNEDTTILENYRKPDSLPAASLLKRVSRWAVAVGLLGIILWILSV